MIQLTKNKISASEFSRKILTDKGTYISVRSKMRNWIASNPIHPDHDIMDFIESNLQRIIVAEPERLESFIKEMEVNGYQNRIYNNVTKSLNDIGVILTEIFNYKAFRASVKAVWLADSINVKSCVYCNTQYSLKINHKGKSKLLFHFDHFFTKSVYPYLSLSYYNLIPCCASCNMSKSDRPHLIKENIHPYVESLDRLAKYEAEPTGIANFLLDLNNNENGIKLELLVRNEFLGDSEIEKKVRNYKNEFKIESQYDQFKDVVAETYLKGLYYNSDRKKELVDFFKQYGGVNLSEEMINRFIMGNYTERKNLLKRPLAKMVRDIGEDLNLF